MENAPPILVPPVSVIVPIYNCAPYVVECLASLKRQSLWDFEAFCIDDCSTDDSLAVVRDFIADDKRFHLFEADANRGLSAVRNRGMDAASGEYLVFLDGDDYLVDDALEKLYARAKAQNLDDLYFSARSFYESRELYERMPEIYDARPAFEGVATGKELFTYFEQHREFLPSAALRMIRRSLVEEHGIRFYEGILHEDILFTFQTLIASRRSSYLNEALYLRRVHEGSIMTQTRRTMRKVEGHFLSVHLLLKWLRGEMERAVYPGTPDEAFIDAFTHRLNEYALIAAGDWHESVEDVEKQLYLDSLTPEQKIEFYQMVVQQGRALEDVKKTRAYRAGTALVSVPRFIRNKMESLRRFRRR